jgi:hypothetical protein
VQYPLAAVIARCKSARAPEKRAPLQDLARRLVGGLLHASVVARIIVLF